MGDNTINLPMSMTMAAFTGISWYIGIELNLRLFLLFKRRKGFYFWCCALCSWGVILQPLFIILTDFEVLKNQKLCDSLILLSWFILVAPQSWVMYSRLHIIVRSRRLIRTVLYVLVFDTMVFAVPTVIIGIVTQRADATLTPFGQVWDQLEVAIFFVQETLLSILYIFQTRKHLKSSQPLHQHQNRPASKTKSILSHLIYMNILIIILDISLLGIRYANYFELQGTYKSCVYGVKLRVEFAILNKLVACFTSEGSRPQVSNHSAGSGSGRPIPKLSWTVEDTELGTLSREFSAGSASTGVEGEGIRTTLTVAVRDEPALQGDLSGASSSQTLPAPQPAVVHTSFLTDA